MNNRLLIVMNGRCIPAVMQSFEELQGVTVCYIRGRTEMEIAELFPVILRQWERSSGLVGVVSDDVVVTQRTVDRVFDLSAKIGGAPASGWCCLDSTSPIASVCCNDLVDTNPQPSSYELETAEWVRSHAEPFRASFAGLALHVMDRGMWDWYPFGAYGDGKRSWASDYHLSRRLNQDGVPILVDPDAFVLHLKERWQCRDRAPEKQLFIGPRYHDIVWQAA